MKGWKGEQPMRDADIRAFLAELYKTGQQHDAQEQEHSKKMLNLEPETAQFLNILIRSSRRTRLLEIGTSNGYSTIWLAWPPQYPGRALRNRFTDQWHSHIDALPQATEARQQLAEAIASKNYDLAYIYAGEAVGLVTRQQSAGDAIQKLGDEAERLLRDRCSVLPPCGGMPLP